jgi:hypothetical protein
MKAGHARIRPEVWLPRQGIAERCLLTPAGIHMIKLVSVYCAVIPLLFPAKTLAAMLRIPTAEALDNRRKNRQEFRDFAAECPQGFLPPVHAAGHPA